MTDLLVGAHVAVFEVLAGIAFLWTFIELYDPSEEGIRRAKWLSLLGFLFVVAGWVVGGTYYVTYYGSVVKPIIKGGGMPWAHSIFMETKEHVFLFTPFLAFLLTTTIMTYGTRLLEDKAARRWALTLTGVIILLGLALSGMGFAISAGARPY